MRSNYYNRIAVLAVAVMLAACAQNPRQITAAGGRSTLATVPPIFNSPAYLREQQRRGVLFSQVRVTPGPDGLQPFFLIADLGKRGVPPLTPQMLAVVRKIQPALRPRYRRHLAFMFDGWYDKQYFVLFLKDYPEVPALNFCSLNKQCRNECPVYVNPVTHLVMITTMNRCADTSAVWLQSKK